MVLLLPVDGQRGQTDSSPLGEYETPGFSSPGSTRDRVDTHREISRRDNLLDRNRITRISLSVKWKCLTNLDNSKYLTFF